MLIATINGYLSECTPGVRIQNYLKKAVPSYNDYAFKVQFRVSQTAFEELTQLLEPLDEFSISSTGVESQFLFLTFLWFLSNPETFRAISDRFDQVESCNLNFTHCMMRAVKCNLMHKFICRPTGRKAVQSN